MNKRQIDSNKGIRGWAFRGQEKLADKNVRPTRVRRAGGAGSRLRTSDANVGSPTDPLGSGYQIEMAIAA